MNCSSCNYTSQPDAKYCANCGHSLWLTNEIIQPQPGRKVNKLLIFLSIFIICESFFYILVNLASSFWSFSIWKYLNPLFILLSLCYGVLPVIISRFLTKGSGARKAFFVLGIIFFCIKFLYTMYYEIYIPYFREHYY
jgi:hypothetical protein